jgi:hypothetical protein
MKKMVFITAGALIIMSSYLNAAITAVPNTSSVSVYDKFEITINSDFGAKNPYDYSELNVQATFRSPDDRTLVIDGFYMKDFNYNADSGSYSEKPGCFKVRYTPVKPGKWKYSVRALKGNKEVFHSEEKTLTVLKSPGRRGFLRVSKSDPLFLEFENNKESFFGIGQNLAWTSRNDLKEFTGWMDRISAAKGNMIRVWMAAWGFGIEWDTQIGNYGPRQQRAYMLDKVVEKAGEDGLYIMLTLVSHGEYTSKINPEWDSNPYNIKNDGILDKPEEFFTNPAARKAFKNRLRYIMARWGYSENIMAWELFNEVDLTENYNSSAVADWHSDISDFIKSRDTYRHLLTTSFSNPNKDPEIWNLSQMDIMQTHIYGLRDEASQIYEASKNKLDMYARPHVTAEFGVGASDDWIKENRDPSGITMHNALWAGAFTLSFAAPMPWYWDSYIDPRGLYHVYTPLRAFIKDIKWDKESFYDLQSRDVFYKKTAEDAKGGDVYIYPVDAWEKAQKNEFKLLPDGTLTNKSGFVSYLYGKSHTDMKNDPVISFKNEEPVKMTVKLSGVSDNNELTIRINNQPAISLEVNAKDFDTKKYSDQWKIYQADISREVSVDIPPGDNDVMIENEGSDWIKVESIKFSNFLNADLAPVFVSGIQGKSSAYMWLKNRYYNYQNPEPAPSAPGYLDVAGMLPGRYVITYYDTYEGKETKSVDYIVEQDTLRVDVPELTKDIAVKVLKYKK